MRAATCYRGDVAERVGQALRRAPYAWLVATAAAMFVLVPALGAVAEPAGEGNAGLAIVTALLVAGQVIAWFVLRRDARLDTDRSASIQWATSSAPFLVAFGLVAAGAEVWAMSVGFLVSVALLLVTARALARSRLA